ARLFAARVDVTIPMVVNGVPAAVLAPGGPPARQDHVRHRRRTHHQVGHRSARADRSAGRPCSVIGPAAGRAGSSSTDRPSAGPGAHRPTGRPPGRDRAAYPRPVPPIGCPPTRRVVRICVGDGTMARETRRSAIWSDVRRAPPGLATRGAVTLRATARCNARRAPGGLAATTTELFG